MGFAINTPYLVLGPNIEYGASGAAAPAGFKGSFVPQANMNFGFSWVEPLGADPYGTQKLNEMNYMRFFAGAELSPFYGTLKAGLGFAPLPPPFTILELRFVYSNENLFWSDVEMPMRTYEKPSIKDRWDAGYIFDNFYAHSSYAQIQSYDVQLGGKYISHRYNIFFLLGFVLVDITSDYDKKSFDYMRGIPLYSRDYMFTGELSFFYHTDRDFSWGVELSSITSGRRFRGNYDKESLHYSIVSTGPMWRFNDGSSYLYISSGFFVRGNTNNNFLADPIKERIILSVEYKHFWNFKFGK